jgi:hypothetical protein
MLEGLLQELAGACVKHARTPGQQSRGLGPHATDALRHGAHQSLSLGATWWALSFRETLV